MESHKNPENQAGFDVKKSPQLFIITALTSLSLNLPNNQAIGQVNTFTNNQEQNHPEIKNLITQSNLPVNLNKKNEVEVEKINFPQIIGPNNQIIKMIGTDPRASGNGFYTFNGDIKDDNAKTITRVAVKFSITFKDQPVSISCKRTGIGNKEIQKYVPLGTKFVTIMDGNYEICKVQLPITFPEFNQSEAFSTTVSN